MPLGVLEAIRLETKKSECRCSSVGQSNAFVKQRSAVQIRPSAPSLSSTR